MTGIGRRHWLAAIALAIVTHLALAYWLDQAPPSIERIHPTALTVSLTVDASGEPGAGPEEQEAATNQRPATKPKGAPRPALQDPSTPPAPQQTVPATTPEPRSEQAELAALEPPKASVSNHELGPPPVERTAGTPQNPLTASPSTRPPASPRVAAAAKRSQQFPQGGKPAPLAKGAGDSAGTAAQMSAAVPAPGNAKPHYPALARRRGYEGRVLIRVVVPPDGRAARAEIKESSGYRVLDRAALEAVKNWRFVPARHRGRPVSSTVEVPVSFRLEGQGRHL